MSHLFNNLKGRFSAAINEMAEALSPRQRRRFESGSASGSAKEETATRSIAPASAHNFQEDAATVQATTSPPSAAAMSSARRDPPTKHDLKIDAEKQQQQQQPQPPNSTTLAGGRRRSSIIEMLVQNEEGDAEEVEIDVADTEIDALPPLIKGGQKCRRQSIADRIIRRRNSEVAADIIRMSAAHRRREFAQLIDEHRAIVRELEQQQQQLKNKPSQRPMISTIRECGGDKENMEQSS